MNSQLATRMARLGTETAFAVSEDANNFKAEGNKVYPFHLGDIDLPTPANIIEAAHRAMIDGKTGYDPSAGIMPLRELLASTIGRDRDVNYGPENVAVQPGGKPVISKFLEIFMNPGDSVLYPNPGFPIYESQINYLGGKAVPYAYKPSDTGFKIDREALEKSINNSTRAIIYNNYQNPLGAESSSEEMAWLAEVCLKHDLMVLSDEAYYHILYSGQPQSIVSIPGMKERTIILQTFSKTYAMTGWRLGAAIGPSMFIDQIAKLNVNIESCTNHFIQYAGIEALEGDQTGTSEILGTLKARRDRLFKELSTIGGLNVSNPNSTFYLFPDVTSIYEKSGADSLEIFRLDTLRNTGVAFCTREHFGSPHPEEDRVFLRFAFSGIPETSITEGLAGLKAYWEAL
ncbi:MAG: aminotransferase class I/II-fold pyridoxal phosphate-dependent enzyme [Deinococcales bacterium]|nr:aminotransferase class I/II-fold pyridoxal phosphate-dependent enzyme [Deinococcales bacterium]